jgi:hypothetical protein
MTPDAAISPQSMYTTDSAKEKVPQGKVINKTGFSFLHACSPKHKIMALVLSKPRRRARSGMICNERTQALLAKLHTSIRQQKYGRFIFPKHRKSTRSTATAGRPTQMGY